MLGRDDSALDHQDVEPRLERDLVVAANLLRRQRRRRYDTLGLDLLDPLGDELGLDRLAVDLLHLPRRRVAREGRDPLELRVGVLVAAVQPLEVEDGQTAELADDAGGIGRDDPVERGREQRKVEAIRAERPRDVDVIGISRAP